MNEIDIVFSEELHNQQSVVNKNINNDLYFVLNEKIRTELEFQIRRDLNITLIYLMYYENN